MDNMDKILFHGKRIDNGEWIESHSLMKLTQGDGKIVEYYYEYFLGSKRLGNVSFDNNGNVYGEMGYFQHPIWYKVDQETIGRLTGLLDRNGKRIFEGDIVDIEREDELFKVEWCEDTARFVLSASTFRCDFDNYWGYEVEIVGNVYDNPELIS